jgi:hypothetical protein
MQKKGGETRAQYYTEQTPLREVDSTLSDGSFTGYIELSENVLSGDYYFVYYGGKAMHAAFVGTKEELITDDEAFEEATNEVGIYEVVDVDIEITEIPSESDDEPVAGDETQQGQDASQNHSSAPNETQAHSGADTPAGQQARSEQTGQDPPPADGQPQADQQPPANQQPPPGDQQQQRTNQARSNEQRGSNERSEPRSESRGNQRPGDEQRQPDTQRRADHQRRHSPSEGTNGRQPAGDERAHDPSTDHPRGAQNESSAEPRTDPGGETPPPDGRSSSEVREDDQSPGTVDARGNGVTDAGDRESQGSPAHHQSPPAADDPDSSRFDEEAAWREADTIPSLDPDRSATPAGTDVETTGQADRPPVDRSQSGPRDHGEGATSDPEVDDAFDAEVLEREDRIDRLTQQVANLKAERDDILRERDDLAQTVDQLREENATLEDELELLEDELERLETELENARGGQNEPTTGSTTAASSGGAQQLGKAEALSGTDLFVRYDSKSEATLEDAHAGDAEPEEVNRNIRLEQHTRFEAKDVTVEGRSYDSFLQDTLGYRFVEWFVTKLPHEIRETGHVDALQDLYATYPEIDRAEIDGSVSIEYSEDGEEIREEVTFDVVIRDRMGNPLVVANLNDQRDPASEEMMVELNEDAMGVKEFSESLGAAVLVTESFFSPGALETAAEATGGSFLSRDSRESFVKLSRKRGYHLCLIEARGDDFHLNEPDL